MESLSRNSSTYKKPSERAARFVLGIFGWIRDIAGSTTTTLPRGHAVQHHGNALPPGKALRYPFILLVEDNPNTAGDFTKAICDYYLNGSIIIFVAHTFDAAHAFFENEEISLVIMDADLDDEDGDGATLTQQFLKQEPSLTILANSSSKISNLKLTGFGAVDTLGKNPEKLKNWLLRHDPSGASA